MLGSSNTLAFLALAASLVSPIVAGDVAPVVGKQRFIRELAKRGDYSNTDHCPGGSIGDADSCTFEPVDVYEKPLKRWTIYGAWIDNCNSGAALTTTVTDTISKTNSFEISTSVSIGIESEGLSAGVSVSFSRGWSNTNSFAQAQAITVAKGEAGNINAATQYIMSRGRVRINYGDRKDGHYIWYSGAEVFVEDPTAPDEYSANVAACGGIDKPAKGVYYYGLDDYAAVTSGPSQHYDRK